MISNDALQVSQCLCQTVEEELAMTSFNADLAEDLKCAVCQDIYKEPMLLPCGHSFCRVCLENLVTNAAEADEGMSKIIF